MARGGRVRTVSVRVRADVSDFEKKIKKMSAKLKKTSKTFTDIGKKISLGITAPVTLAFTSMIKGASDLQENMNKTDEVFKSGAKGIQNWSKTTLRAFGIAQSTALDMASTFGDMSTSMGLTPELSAEMSKNLVGLAGDLASFKNIGIERTKTALSAVYTGETEALKGLGVVMTQAELTAFAMSKGIEDNFQNMSQAQKVLLRYQFVINKTQNAQGDFSRTNKDAANQMRIFTEGAKQLSANFGRVLLPYFAKGITYVNNIIERFDRLSESQKKTTVLVAGLTATIGPLLIIIGSVAKSLSGLPALFSALTSPISIKILAIAGLVGVLVTLYNTNEDVKNAMDASWKFLSTTIPSYISDIDKAISDWDTGMMEKVVRRGNKIAAWFDEKFPSLNLNIMSEDDIKESMDEYEKNKHKGTSFWQSIKDSIGGVKKEYEATLNKFDVYSLLDSFGDWKNVFDSLGNTGVDAYDNLTSSAKDYINAVRQQTNTFANFVGLFERAERQTFSPGRLLSNLRGQVKILQQWQSNLATLQQRGLSNELMSQLRSMGAGASGQIQALTTMSDERLAEFQNLYGQRMGIAGQEAQKQLEAQSKIETLIESQINITISNSNIRSDDDVEKTAQKIIQKLKLAGVRI